MNKWTGGMDGQSHLGLGGQRDRLGLGVESHVRTGSATLSEGSLVV